MADPENQSPPPTVGGNIANRGGRQTPTDGSPWASVLALVAAAACLAAADYDEFNVKREQIFEFVQKPVVTRRGDKVTIEFETKAFCDVTVAIEGRDRRIVRHLASGVLGPNAPTPFQKTAKKQSIVWDGKDDQGAYVEDKDKITVRVSLGLKARFERQLLHSSHRRIGPMPSLVCAQPEGVYVFEGCGVDWLRLFDHEGNYVRTVYPFPARNLDKLVGVKQHTFPQSGKTLPLKWGFYETTLLSSGYSGLWGDYMLPRDGPGASVMAMRNRRIALAGIRLNRIATDGSSGGMPLEGPTTHFKIRPWYCVPRSGALSPDGKTLYLAGFAYDRGYDGGNHEWIHGVGKVDMAAGADGKVATFAGSLKLGWRNGGDEPGQFKSPCSVDCDPQGRVYVADHFNDRVQVFDPDGKHLESIPHSRPSEVCIDQQTGHIWVFSWMRYGRWYGKPGKPVKATLTHLGAFDDPKRIEAWPLKMSDRYMATWQYANRTAGFQYRGAIDSWSREDGRPMVWLVPGGPGGRALARPAFRDSALGRSAFGGIDKHGRALPDMWAKVGLKMFRPKDDGLALVRDFGRDAMRDMIRPRVPGNWRYRLYVRPTTGHLYVLDVGHKPIRIDPETGREAFDEMPFSVEDMAFDINGLAYLRTHNEVVRYSPDGWKEVPFDYGQERTSVGLWKGKKGKGIAAALRIPTEDIWHQGGLWVSPKGHLAVAFYGAKMDSGRESRRTAFSESKTWKPTRFPGRKGDNVIHVWDKHGRIVYEDAVPGLGITDGIAMDKDDNLYLLAAATRMLDGKRYWDKMTGTLIKVAPKKKVLSTGASIPLKPSPERPPATVDGQLGQAWYEGAEWFYGGLYFTGKDADHAMGGCACWNGRFAHDYFARSFAPETQHYTVAVLDKNGNLIMRIGQYGNVDDGVPLGTVPFSGGKMASSELAAARKRGLSPSDGSRAVANAETGTGTSPRLGASPRFRSIGGDEVALFYPVYLATHSDRRLFVADPGNARIVSVKLGYNTTERVALKDVPDGGGNAGSK